MLIKVAGLSGLLFLTGCASLGNSQYSCSGIPDGIKCMSPEQVYQATNSADPVFNAEDADQNGSAVQQKTLGHTGYQLPPTPLPMPIRTSAKVMRIWVAPWEDKSGDLHMPNYVFSEIETRRWNLGEDAVKNRSNIAKPLENLN